ncbi:MAG: hypothetical protein KatS3mg105_2257 [Gemmatales bacterium]|nr:MAG: hypothetical protein KatS3mg105_2257 [Gemmatales bacterium]
MRPARGFSHRPMAVQLLGVALGVAFLSGCHNWSNLRGRSPLAPAPAVSAAVPTSSQLVRYLNDNAKRMQTLEVRELQMDATQKLRSIGMSGQMVAQKPNNFRLVARVGGTTVCDLGSNQQEFWYWLSKADPPYLFHCSHQDFARVPPERMPFPFQPEWVIEALGMAELDPNGNYEVITNPRTIELVERTKTPQGLPVRKKTVFNRADSAVQVVAHLLEDQNGKTICAAYVREVQHDPATGAVVPRRVELVWPEQSIKLKLKLNEVSVNRPMSPERSARLFARPQLRDVRTYDLAGGIGQPTGLRPVGGYRLR